MLRGRPARFVALGAVVLAATAAVAAQQLAMMAPKGTGLVVGRVIDGTTGEPISHARVAITAPVDRVLTDAEGHFAFFDLPAGTYTVWVFKEGYSVGELGMRWTAPNTWVERPGDVSPSRQRVVLAGGERRGDLTVRMWRHGAIAGRVIDEAGEPMVGVLVQARPRVYAGGRPWLNDVLAGRAWTDDRGLYRIGGLLPGDYTVVMPSPSITIPDSLSVAGSSEAPNMELWGASHGFAPTIPFRDKFAPGTPGALFAGRWMQGVLSQPVAGMSPEATRRSAYVTTWFPGVITLANADVLSVSPGRTHGGVDFALRPHPVHHVLGRVAAPNGPAAGISVALVSRDEDPRNEIRAALGVTDSRGEFALLSVPSGQYRLEAHVVPRSGQPSSFQPLNASDLVGQAVYTSNVWTDEPALCGSMPLDVNADLDAVTLTLHPGAVLSGTVVFTGSRPPPDRRELERISVEIERPDGRLRAVRPYREIQINADAQFRSLGLPPGRYFIRAPRPPAGWTLESAMVAGRDVSIEPLEVEDQAIGGIVLTFNDTPAALSGTVLKDDGTPDGEASVAIFPSDRRKWVDFGLKPPFIRHTRVDPDGRFAIAGLPAGAYHAIAVDDALMAAWPSPPLFERFAGQSERIEIHAGESQTRELRTRVIR